MTFLFNDLRSFPTHICFEEILEDEQTVCVSEKLWNDISFGQDRFLDRLAISLTSRPHAQLYQYQGQDSSLALKNIICWASCPLSVSSAPTHGITVPSSWKVQYHHILSESMQSPAFLHHPHHWVFPVTPALLTNVFVIALSKSAYDLAQQQPLQVETWLSQNQRIIRIGDRHACILSNERLYDKRRHPDAHRYEYEIAMAEPVLQGCATLGSTRFFILPSSWDEEKHINDSADEDDHVSNCFDENAVQNGPPKAMQDSDETFEIDENFLASSTLRTLHFSLPQRNSESCGTHVPLRGTDLQSNDISLMDAAKTLRSSSMLFSGSKFLTKPAVNAVELFYDANATMFLRTADLRKTGLFSGDWAIVCASDSTDYRLVQVFTDDSVVKSADTILASPLLLHNIYPGNVKSEEFYLIVRTSPFGAHSPSVPIAKTATLARIASPVSIDRRWQPLFLRSLKAYFDGGKRMAKKGDVIAVAINTDNAYAMQEVGEALENIENDNSNDMSYYCGHLESETSNVVVFFVITDLEYDTVISAGDGTPPDTYIGSTTGELGCWIDSTITRLVQVGVEHSVVPDISNFFGTDHGNQLEFCDLKFDNTEGSRPSSRLYDLASATLGPNAAAYCLYPSVLLKGARGTGKRKTVNGVAQRLGMHILDVNCFDVIGESEVKTEGTLLAQFDKAISCSPCIFLLRNIDALTQTTQVLETGKAEPSIVTALKECIEHLSYEWKVSGYPVLVVATTSNAEKVPTGVLSCFKQEISFEAPGEVERFQILWSLLRDTALAADVSLKAIATQTAALLAADLKDLTARALQAAIKRVSTLMREHHYSEADITHAGVVLTGADFDDALSKARASYSQSIGAPKIPNVSWDDVGGLASVKSDILDTIQLPLEHPEMFAKGLKKRSGILLYGPPGTGKTLLAKAVATSCSLNFFSVKGPELLNMYIGESEANVRRVFQRARDAKPCVIFFDELDSVAPKRGNHGDSGGVMDRIVSQLLSELDGMSDGKGGSDVFVIGATNRPDLLDPALLRPGRFDRMLYLGVSDTHDAQLNILEALTRKFRLHPNLDLRDIAIQCPFNYTGADFYALCSDAMLKAMSRKAEEIEEKIDFLNKAQPLPGHPYPLSSQYYLSEFASPADIDVLVSRTDFEQALRGLVPSVSKSDMEHYSLVQQHFTGNTLHTTRNVNGKGKATETGA